VPNSLTTPHIPSFTVATLSGLRVQECGFSAAVSLRSMWGLCQMPPMAMPPIIRANCRGETVSAPWPMATEMVSPGYHFWR